MRGRKVGLNGDDSINVFVQNEDELIYATEASDNVECDTVGEEVVLDQDGFQEMEVNLQVLTMMNTVF